MLIPAIKKLFPRWLINHFYHWPKSVLANIIYGFPSKKLVLIGVTGTSGKTSVAHLIYHILKTAGLKVALISTVAAKIGNQEIDTGWHVTSPNPFFLQKLLRRIVNQKYRYVVLEVTSHALDQCRTWGCRFSYGILTNITHEHLDYHRTFAKYQKAKLKLLKKSRIAVLNQKDSSYKIATKSASGKIITFDFGKTEFICPALPGRFNQENIAAASAVTRDLGISQSQIKKSLVTFPGIPGRMEILKGKHPFTIVIDFAHKPDALKKALQSLKIIKGKSGRLIAVFGCAGLRDTRKRPIMGEISCSLAEISIITEEDPRIEKVNKIIDQIAAGCLTAGAVQVNPEKWENSQPQWPVFIKIPDRQQAINFAIGMAEKNDLVVFFGKGHEKSMCFGKIEYPWSEHQAINKALKLRDNK